MLYTAPAITVYSCFIAALLGACMGSFLNCAAWRIVHGESVLRGRSHCDVCGHVLAPRDLVPVFSYVFSRGRCRYCGAKLSPRHAVGEAVAALVFVSLLLRYDISLRTLEAWAVACLLLACAFADLEGYIIPDRFIAVGVVLFIVTLFFVPDPGKRALDGLIGGIAVGGGVLLLALGAVTMVLGAVIAVFSNNLKYILACSSLSQIGFILVGTAALSLLGQHNALAAHGTVLYMMNHSLVKLTLFLLAGVVYCNTHALDLNQIRGFGRGKPLLHILFLCGACSLAGIPGFLGYISKTLVHESLVELAAESGSLGVTAVEWLFLFSGGLTAAYLTKIYAALFWQKPAASTGRTWGTPATTAALILAALPLPVLGLLPHVLAEPVAALALPFVGGHPFGHAVHYLAWENLKGVAISLTIGMAVYFLFIRLVLMDRREGQVVYLERWPRWLSLEDRVYRPAIRGLYRLLNVVLRAVCDALDFLVLVARRTFLRDSRPRRRKSPRSAVLHAMTHGGQRTEQEAADRLGTILDTIRRMEGSLSYALLMACLGLCIVLVCILLYVF